MRYSFSDRIRRIVALPFESIAEVMGLITCGAAVFVGTLIYAAVVSKGGGAQGKGRK
jgi:hypothetical protein